MKYIWLFIFITTFVCKSQAQNDDPSNNKSQAINDSIKKYVQYGAFSWYRAELLTGAYDALVNSGDSELIKNDELTKQLTEYFSIITSGFEDQETSMNLLNNMQIIV